MPSFLDDFEFDLAADQLNLGDEGIEDLAAAMEDRPDVFQGLDDDDLSEAADFTDPLDDLGQDFFGLVDFGADALEFLAEAVGDFLTNFPPDYETPDYEPVPD